MNEPQSLKEFSFKCSKVMPKSLKVYSKCGNCVFLLVGSIALKMIIFLASLIFHTLNFYANKHIKAWHLCINFMFFLSFPSGTCLSAHTRIEILLINLSHVFLYSSSLILSFVHCFLRNKQLKDNCFVREEFLLSQREIL